MKKRIIAFALCILLLSSSMPPYAYASQDYGSNVGKYAQLNSYYADSTVIVPRSGASGPSSVRKVLGTIRARFSPRR